MHPLDLFIETKILNGHQYQFIVKNRKKSNLVIHDAINNILINNKLIAPKLINKNYKKNYIEIEDFGNLTVFQLLRKKKNK